MKYCYKCGNRLELKFLKNEGEIPYCNNCSEFVFPIFSTAVSMIILNDKIKKSLIVKQYNTGRYRLVAGYVNKGERAEATVKREIKEELGIDIISSRILRTKYYEKSNTLMINFLVYVDSEYLIPNEEIDEYDWYDIHTACDLLPDGSVARYFFEEYLKNEYK